jgi:MFS transporter, DHA3 family, macrolide efflux protein
VAGNTVFGLADQLSLMIGPALAGVVAAAAGPAVVIAADAASWAVLAISYARVAPLATRLTRASNPPSPGPRPASAQSPRSGWAVIRSSPVLPGLLALSFVFYLLYGPVDVALPVHVATDLHGSAALLGTFWAVFGVGAIIGELSAPYLRRWRVWPTMTGIVLGWGLARHPARLGPGHGRARLGHRGHPGRAPPAVVLAWSASPASKFSGTSTTTPSPGVYGPCLQVALMFDG